METQPSSSLPLKEGIHVMHLFYNLNRVRWASLEAGQSRQVMAQLEALCSAHAAPSRLSEAAQWLAG